MGYKTSRCSLFKDLVHKGLNEGISKFGDKPKHQMKVDYDPLKDASMMYAGIAGYNMVEEIIEAVEGLSVEAEVEAEDDVAECQMSNIMPKQSAWNRIVAYLADNEIKKALVAELKQNMVVGTIEKGTSETFTKEPKEMMVEGQKLDCIFDGEPSEFEDNLFPTNKKIQAQDSLEEIDLGDGSVKRPSYVSSKIGPDFKTRLVALWRGYKDCFARDYSEMPGLSRNVLELKLPI